MRCDECNIRDAQYTIAIVAGKETSTRHLCEVCMEKLRAKGEQVGFAEMIHQAVHAIVFKGTQAELPQKADLPAISCPGCSTTLKSVMDLGQVGCARCYDTFRDHLQQRLKVLRQAVQAKTEPHWQREITPPHANQLWQEELTRQLKAAIEAEDYELAAKLRDQLSGKEAAEG